MSRTKEYYQARHERLERIIKSAVNGTFEGLAEDRAFLITLQDLDMFQIEDLTMNDAEKRIWIARIMEEDKHGE